VVKHAATISANPPEIVSVAAADGYRLAAQLWHPPERNAPRAVAVINAGAGVSQRYYGRFAEHLAAAGIATLTYDYRGIGGSRPSSLAGFAASVEQWGSADFSSVLEFAARRYSGCRRVVIGHSVGGFVTGFATNCALVDQLLLVGAHTGYWRDYAPRARPWMYLLWHAFMPMAASLIGYFPGRALRLGDDLPAGVAKEWANRRRGEFWWNLRTPSGEPDAARRDELLGRFLQLRARTLALRFTDDAFATRSAVERLLSLYANAEAEVVALGPGDAAGHPIGHFGFFRARMRTSLWPRVVAWLQNAHGDRPAMRAPRAAA
jgi:predicted alpha/beta hydrolase